MLAGSTDPSLHGLNGVGTALTWAENVSMTIHDCSGLALGRRNGVGRMRFLATYLPTYPGPPRAAVAPNLPTYFSWMAQLGYGGGGNSELCAKRDQTAPGHASPPVWSGEGSHD